MKNQTKWMSYEDMIAREEAKKKKKKEKYVKFCGGIQAPPLHPPLFGEDKAENGNKKEEK